MIWGVAAALLANLLHSTGFVLEKRALTSLPPLHPKQPCQTLRALAGKPLWLVGGISVSLGFAAQLAAYRTLPIVVAQGLFICGLGLLLLLSTTVLGEKPAIREWRAIAAIVVALAMILLSLREGAGPIGRTTSADVLLTLCIPTIGLSLWLYRGATRRERRRHRQPTSGTAFAVAIGLLYGVSSLATKGVSGQLTLAEPTSTAPAVLLSPHPYLLLVTGTLGLLLSQTALQRCRVSLIVPVSTAVTCVFSMLMGSLAFREPIPSDPLQITLGLGGTTLALTALRGLSRRPHST
ncbi:hypothetical protein [Streptomyces chartreusis]|uniref:hypothetical protein n=1 Tax=Streptomyces chartreusis TaxID=1969 RepID=UPI0033ECE930